MSVKNKLLTKKFNDAVNLERKGDYSSAMKAYVSILKRNKGFREGYLNLGSLYARMNRLSDALTCYNAALTIDKDYLTFFNLGCIYYKLGEYKKGVINLQKSKNIQKNFILSSLVMGLCYSRLQDIRAAEVSFNEVLRSLPHNRVALTALAILYYNSGRFNEALKLLDKLMGFSKISTSIQELKSDLLFKNGKVEESAAEMKSLKKNSKGYQVYDEFIKSIPVQELTDRYGTIEEKIASLEEKSDKHSLISLSLCHLFNGDTDSAIDYLFQARKILIN